MFIDYFFKAIAFDWPSLFVVLVTLDVAALIHALDAHSSSSSKLSMSWLLRWLIIAV